MGSLGVNAGRRLKERGGGILTRERGTGHWVARRGREGHCELSSRGGEGHSGRGLTGEVGLERAICTSIPVQKAGLQPPEQPPKERSNQESTGAAIGAQEQSAEHRGKQ